MRRWLLTVLAGVLGGSAGCDSRVSTEPAPPAEASAPSEAITPAEPAPPLEAPAACVPTTCALQHQTCGELADGCGTTLACGAACATPPPSTSVCAGLLPAQVSPLSRDIFIGYVRRCSREPAVDGQGSTAFAEGAAHGYHGVSHWHMINPEGDIRDYAFYGNPWPRLWPQARGFHMVSTLEAYGDYNSFRVTGEAEKFVVDEPIGDKDNPRQVEVSSAPDPTGGTVVAWLERVTDASSAQSTLQVKVRRYDSAGRRRFGESIVTASPASGAPSTPRAPLVVGTDEHGRTLVLWTERESTSGTDSTVGRWLGADGMPTTSIFPTRIPAPPAASWQQPSWTLAPLIGGGLALQALETWTHGFASGATQEGPLPAGLQGRQGRLERVRGGKAYALLLPAGDKECGRRVEVLAPEGTSCGTLTFGAETCENQQLVIGAEGSILQRQRINDPVVGSDGEIDSVCTLTWWPGLLR